MRGERAILLAYGIAAILIAIILSRGTVVGGIPVPALGPARAARGG